jgi:Methyltransferase domain
MALFAIDTFLGSLVHWDLNRPDGVFSSLRILNGYPQLYYTFLANVAAKGYQENVIPLPQTSENAAMILKRHGIKADLIHIDAAHEYEPALRDAKQFWELLSPGGVMVGDDYPWPRVAKAANEFAASIGAELAIDNPKWVIRKNRNLG